VSQTAKLAIENEIKKLVARARVITATAEAQGRAISDTERGEIKHLIEQTNALKDQMGDIDRNEYLLSKMVTLTVANGGTPTVPGNGITLATRSLSAAVKASGVLDRARPGQIVREFVSRDARGTKGLLDDVDSSGDAYGDLPARQVPGVDRLAIIERYAYPVFGAQNIDAGTAQVQYLQQIARDLADPDAMLMDFASDGEKPETGSTVRLVTADAKMIATLTDFIPNALLGRQDLRSVVDADCRIALAKALDKYVSDAVLANPSSATSGVDLIEAIVRAQQTVRDAGYNPTVTLVSSNDATEIALYRADGVSGNFLAGYPALGQVRIVDAATDGEPIVLDPSALGDLYVGGTAVDVDGFTEFDTNQSRLRFEFPTLFVVRHADAAAVGGLTS
jgi:hypothetical protein